MFDIKEAGRFIEEQLAANPLFDHYRIVDASTYTVHKWDGERAESQNTCCYEIWNRGAACQNCVSRLAVEEGRPIIKMETLEDRVFLIQSVPLPELGSPLALELIRDVTDSLLLNDPEHQGNVALTEIVQKMNDLANHDSYTGLFNKRFMELELHRQVENWVEAVPFVIVLLDIDRFKDVNDTYGHLMGDQVILTLANALNECAQQNNGWASRVGGDEFLLAFEGIRLPEVKRLIKAFCEKISRMRFGAFQQYFHISISVGIAEYQTEVGDWHALFQLADQEMYLSKQRHAMEAAQKTE